METTCKYNNAVLCDRTINCKRCGWSPEVEKKRKAYNTWKYRELIHSKKRINREEQQDEA